VGKCTRENTRDNKDNIYISIIYIYSGLSKMYEGADFRGAVDIIHV